MKNWLTEIPKTDGEAIEALRFEKPDLVGANLEGIYRVRRAQGESVLGAYEKALLAFVDAMEAR